MTQEQLHSEGSFRTSVSILKYMLEQGWLDEKEYKFAIKKLLREYRPVIGSLWCR